MLVVGFTPETEEEREQECMESLFGYLDSLPDWEYSLFLLTRENEGFIKKVSGSLLYPRREPEK